MGSGKYLCHCSQKSLEHNFSDVFIVACVFSMTGILCACFITACQNVIPRKSAISCTPLDTKFESLSVIFIVVRYPWLAIILRIPSCCVDGCRSGHRVCKGVF